MASLSHANIVVLARNFNPSIVSKDWLWKKQIIRESASNFVFTAPFVRLDGPSFAFALDESRLQLTLRDPAGGLTKLPQAARRFIKALPETPYTALGFNFRFALPVPNLSLETIIAVDVSRVRRLFGQDYELGVRVAFPFEDFAVRAEIPAAVPSKTVAEISFNFHSDVSGGQMVIERLSRHAAALRKARALVEAVAPDA